MMYRWMCAGILLLLFTGNLWAQQPLNPVQLSQMQTVGSIYLHEDGKTGAYTLSVPADPMKENALPSSHLYLLDVGSGESTTIETEVSVGSVAFRPGKSSLTFLAKYEGDETRSLYEYDPESGEKTKLFEFERNINSYEWAADGDHFVFLSEEPKEETESPLPYQPEIYEEGLSNTWAYMQNASKEGHMPHRIPVEGDVVAAHWSPDLSKIAVAAAPTSLVDDFYMAQKIYIVDHQTREITATIDHEGKLGSFSWCPESKHLAMIAAATLNDPIDGRIKIADVESGAADMILADYPGKFEQLKWIDENTIQFLASKGVYSELGTVLANGEDMQVQVPAGGVILNAFARADDGSFLFDAESPMHPDEVYKMGSSDKEPVRVTNSNPWLDDVALGKQEVVTFTTKDGFDIEGILIYPVGYEKGKRYPVINVIHGGPEAHFDNGWLTSYSQSGQLAAGEGIAVFYPNYRGSTGRGLEFAMSSQRDLAGKEFDDIVEGVDYLISEGIADGDRVGVTGGSYGGYATAWMATRYSDRFAAGVMFVGIANNISKWGTSDIPEELYQVHSRKRIWEDYQDYLERSPIYYVDNAKTPLLIMHGKNDTRVDPGQSYELYRHIKTRTDTPVRLVLYPGEGHGNRRATAQFDYNLRMMRWFNQYLKGEKVRPDMELDLEAVPIKN